MTSKYNQMFGAGSSGRPRKEDMPVGINTGNPAITATARRRATRVLRTLHRKEFEDLMKDEAEFLLKNSRALALKG